MERQLQKLTQAILVRGELLKQLEVQCAAIQASVEEMKPKPVTPPAQASSSTPPAQASSSRSLATGELDALMPTGCSMNCPNDDTDSRTSAFMPDAAPGPPSTAALLDVAITSPEPTDSTILVRDGTGELTPTPSGTAVHPVDLGDEHVPNLSNCQLGARKVFDRMCGTDGISYGFSTNGLILTTCCLDESSTAGIAVVDRATRRRGRAHRVLILARLENSCGAIEFRPPWPPPTQVDVACSGVEPGPMSWLSCKDYRGVVKWMPPWSPPVPGRLLILEKGFCPATYSTQISSFSESKSDDKRFYIITPTKTLQLRTGCAKDRVAWIEALVSARSEYSLNGGLPCDQNDGSFSTEKLRNHLHSEGVGEVIIKDCEQIVHSEFSQYHTQMKQRCEDYLSLIGSLRQGLEVVNSGDATITEKSQSQLFKAECSSSGKCSEYSNTESSDDAGKQEIGQLSDENEFHFYDTRQSFSESTASPDLKIRCLNYGNEAYKFGELLAVDKANEYLLPSSKRRSKLPEPVEKEKCVSLWSMIKDNVGKDLTRVCLPVYFNEPLSFLQKCFEGLEYSYLLDRAYECGLRGNGLMRILYVAAFVVSGYASTDGRPCKPFNPLLGETYKADYPEKRVRFFSEKVSHHPMVMACHCEGKGWKFWGDSSLKSKFWGQSIQLDPSGMLTLEFDDGETFQWSKVQGFVTDADGTKVASLMGKWDESMYGTVSDDAFKVNSHGSRQIASATLLREKNEPSDSRLRPDQLHLENGEYEKANSVKLRLETRQRMAWKMALRTTVESLSEEEIGGLKELSKMIDTDNIGTITFDELSEAGRKFGSDGVQVGLGMEVLLIPWDPGGNDDDFSVSTWGQVEIQGGRNVTYRHPCLDWACSWAVGQEAKRRVESILQRRQARATERYRRTKPPEGFSSPHLLLPQPPALLLPQPQLCCFPNL